MNDPRGSGWRKWDLHVHTPASIVHQYGAAQDVWDRYVTSLEALPPEFAVIGVNDYMFLDGYRKLLEYKAKGRLENIVTLLPVLEFRLAAFAGTDGKLRRINFHVIFSNELTSDVIEQQFLSQLQVAYQLTPGLRADWGGVLSRGSLADLGSAIIESAPADKRGDYGPPMIEGFNNLNLPVEALRGALESPYLDGRYVTAIGKTEWSSLKWNEQSIAEKKSLINAADLVFVAAENCDAHARARNALIEWGVNARLLDCSDAHGWAGSENKDVLGNCDTWIKADPTFRGLQHAIFEFDERVFVGSEPPKLVDVRRRPGKYVDSLHFSRLSHALAERWFEGSIEFNPGLVAIVGNKGGGKSALADIIALGGNSRQEKNFSFLNSDKFRNAREDKSRFFGATLVWRSKDRRSFSLADSADQEDVERIRYIPQSYLEKLCNELAADGATAFDRELRGVIFSHIPVAERLGKQSLDSLLAYLGEETVDRAAELRAEMSKVNREIAALEEDSAPEYRRELEKRRTARLREVSVLKGSEPRPVPKPDADEDTQKAVDQLQAKIQEQRAVVSALEDSVDKATQDRKMLVARVATIDKVLQRIRNLEESCRLVQRESEGDLASVGVEWRSVVRLSVDTGPLKTLRSELAAEEAVARSQLDPDESESDVARLAVARENVASLKSQLDLPMRRYEEYVTAHDEWKAEVARLETDVEDDDSVASLETELQRVAGLPKRIRALEDERKRVTGLIYEQLLKLKDHYQRLYRPVQEFIEQHQTLASSIQLSFDVRIEQADLAGHLSEWINKQRSGSFQGAEDGAVRIKELVKRNSFDSTEGVEAFLSDLMQAVKADLRHEPPREMSPAAQLRSSKTVSGFYDFLFGLSYLRPRYALKMEGKELLELSPGERGLLLLLFYLLVEKGDGPLILDQPEENLDNETIHEVLVPSIKLAKRRRQVFIVTHNPNLAVVADADQVVVASIDKQQGCVVSYETGALENPAKNEFVVRYLEGTLPAFLNREMKYIRVY